MGGSRIFATSYGGVTAWLRRRRLAETAVLSGPAVPPGAAARQAMLGEREMHLVDLENLAGGPVFEADAVRVLRLQYVAVSAMREDAHVALAAGSGDGLLEGSRGWGSCRLLFRPGVDGADLALLQVGEEHLAERFGRVVIGSGDGIFADLAARLQTEGVAVTVVGRPGHISRRLARAVADVRHLPALACDVASTAVAGVPAPRTAGADLTAALSR